MLNIFTLILPKTKAVRVGSIISQLKNFLKLKVAVNKKTSGEKLNYRYLTNADKFLIKKILMTLSSRGFKPVDLRQFRIYGQPDNQLLIVGKVINDRVFDIDCLIDNKRNDDCGFNFCRGHIREIEAAITKYKVYEVNGTLNEKDIRLQLVNINEIPIVTLTEKYINDEDSPYIEPDEFQG